MYNHMYIHVIIINITISIVITSLIASNIKMNFHLFIKISKHQTFHFFYSQYSYNTIIDWIYINNIYD
jgi:hypothetical protein